MFLAAERQQRKIKITQEFVIFRDIHLKIKSFISKFRNWMYLWEGKNMISKIIQHSLTVFIFFQLPPVLLLFGNYSLWRSLVFPIQLSSISISTILPRIKMEKRIALTHHTASKRRTGNLHPSPHLPPSEISSLSSQQSWANTTVPSHNHNRTNTRITGPRASADSLPNLNQNKNLNKKPFITSYSYNAEEDTTIPFPLFSSLPYSSDSESDAQLLVM